MDYYNTVKSVVFCWSCFVCSFF